MQIIQTNTHFIETGYLPRLCRRPKCERSAIPGHGFCDDCLRLAAIETVHDNECVRVRRLRKHWPDFIFLYAMTDGERLKVGQTQKPCQRRKAIEQGVGKPVKLIGAMPCRQWMESAVFRYLTEDRLFGEWFSLSPRACLVAELIRAHDLRTLLEVMHAKKLDLANSTSTLRA